MTKVAFGAYRVSIDSSEHEQALKKAFDNKVPLIDTSANYTDGNSERLIGKVLSDHKHRPLIVSKVGYIQGENLKLLATMSLGEKAKSEIIHVSESLKHSISPDFIEDQILRSLERLNIEVLDAYLLHNPEYYFKSENPTKKEYYRRIKDAFEKLEELVERGLIKYYGVSSNSFSKFRENEDFTDLDILFGAAREIKANHHFKYIQFPMNLLEMNPLIRQYDQFNLIERAKQFNLITMSNRPFNCFTSQGLLRLATYEVDEMYQDASKAEKIFNKCMESLVVKWLEQREDESDKLFEIPLMKQIKNIWYKQNSKDAVDQIFSEYFFPLIASIWGENLTPKESSPFYDLYDHAIQFSLANMNKRAQEFEKQAVEKGLVSDSNLSLTHKAIEKYQSLGVDYVLAGMRANSYVEDLKSFF